MKYLLFLDYDGTLTPIVKEPRLAVLSAAHKTVLKKLAQTPDFILAIISGRQLSDVKRMIGMSNIAYVGNHGFELEINGVYNVIPQAKRFAPVLKAIKKVLIQNVKIPGVFIEDKKFTLSVHYRLVAQKQVRALIRLFFEAIKPWNTKIHITKGKKVFEIRPPIAWHKGKAVTLLLKEFSKKIEGEKVLPIYIGDDQTDEDAFRVLKGKGKTFLVGKKKKTLANGRFKNVAAVYDYLKWMLNNES